MKTQVRRLTVVLSIMLVMGVFLTACQTAKPKSMTIGILDPLGLSATVDGFKAGLVDLKYVEGQNITFITAAKPAAFDAVAIESTAQELVNAKVDLIYCVTTSACTVAKKITAGSNIAVVFVAVTDPVATGLVQDFTKPGGNITGIASAAKGSVNEGRRLEWLLEIAPNAKRVLVPYNPSDSATLTKLEPVKAAAQKLGIELVLKEVKTTEEAITVPQNIPEDVSGIFTFSERIFTTAMLQELANVAIQRKLPYSAPAVDFGALTSYSSDMAAMGKQAARLADQIFKGVKPADLPVESPEFFLSISLKTANAIGLTISDSILNKANNIVR